MLYIFVLVLLMVTAFSVTLSRHRRHRRALYRDLAESRSALANGFQPRIQTPLSPRELRATFDQERIIHVPDFLTPESLSELRAECQANRHHVDRSYLPPHKKGGTLSYENIHRHAKDCLAFYHSPRVRQWLAEVVGEPLQTTADHDQSSCSLLYYDRAGDHISWHYDHNFYRGRHFTILLSLVNRSPDGGVSAGRLMQKKGDSQVIELDTAENVLVMFEGAKVLHRASPVQVGDERIMLSMTLCTDPAIHPLKELARRVKDTAYYGLRALID